MKKGGEDAKTKSACGPCSSSSSSSSASAVVSGREEHDVENSRDVDVMKKRRLFPPSREEIGRSSWKVLHSMAARYPRNPTFQEKCEAAAWIYAFSSIYPCNICRTEFYPILRGYPPQVNTREDFVLWTCFVHNKVNEDISAPLFPCKKNFDHLLSLGI
ncbi:erv1 alr family protein [Cystoisospora suis]|uniref:Sulfhydryl oxidase n=1 Tax=Cystoisospora suis TaxID=483139 RepID=A0A2C6KM64_9APIC|nr:erv1 alr family protein [Cystoisospora suis]